MVAFLPKDYFFTGNQSFKALLSFALHRVTQKKRSSPKIE